MDCSISMTTLFIGILGMQTHTTVMSVFCLIIPVVGILFGNHFLTIQISLQRLLKAASNSCQSAIIKQASHLFSKKNKDTERWIVAVILSVLHWWPCSRLTNYSRHVYFGLWSIYTRPSSLSQPEVGMLTDLDRPARTSGGWQSDMFDEVENLNVWIQSYHAQQHSHSLF